MILFQETEILDTPDGFIYIAKVQPSEVLLANSHRNKRNCIYGCVHILVHKKDFPLFHTDL